MESKFKLIIILIFANLCFQSPLMANMIKVKGGVFTPLYGTQKKPAKIDDFYIDENPVTNQEFLDFVKHEPIWSKSKAKEKTILVESTYLNHWTNDFELGKKAPPDSPVVFVSWHAAKAYCQFKGLRLPTVNEWEFIASQPIPGRDIKKIILDWYSIPTPEVLPSVKVGFKNTTGVSNLHGVIWEWTLDFNSAMVTGESRADGSLDKTLYCGSGSSGASDKSDYGAFLRFGMRSSLKANYAVANLGFRCAKDKD